MKNNKMFFSILIAATLGSFALNISLFVKMNNDKNELHNLLNEKFSPESSFVKSIQAEISKDMLISMKNNDKKQLNDLEEIIKEAEKTYSVYSENYIQMLTENAAKNKELLYPENSLSEYVNEKNKAFLQNEDLKNYEKALNNGIITPNGEIRNSTNELVERLKKIYPKKTEIEIFEMISNSK